MMRALCLLALLAAACGSSDEDCTDPCGEDCCGAGQVCYLDACCSPACDGKDCGDDACGGSCGTCGVDEVCSIAGRCIAGQAALEVDRTFLRFNDVAVGYPAVGQLVVSNAGDVDLTLDVSIRGGAGSPFEVLGVQGETAVEPVPAAVPPGSSIELLVEYDPAAHDADDFDILEINTNDPEDCPTDDNPCEVQLNGTGAAPDPELEVTCSGEDTCPAGGARTCQVILDPGTGTHPARLAFNFCEVSRGTNRELSAELSNTGNAALTIGGFAFDPAIGAPDDFRLIQPGDGNVVLQPGEAMTMTVLYAPADEGVDNTGMDLSVNDTDVPDGALQVRLIALSTAPDIDVHPQTIPFEGVDPGSTETQIVTIYNTGTGTLEIEPAEVSGGSVADEFIATPAAPLSVTAAGQVQLEVTYAPQDAGSDVGSVLLRSNDPDEPSVVIELGPGLRPDLDVTPEQVVEFADVPHGGDAELEVGIANVGHADLTVSGLSIVDNPGDPPVFGLLAPPTPFVLAPAESISVTVTFQDDTSIADEAARLEIGHDSPNDQVPYVLRLRNVGTPVNHPPVAIIEPQQQQALAGQPVTLSGQTSYDPDADDSVTRYVWAFSHVPVDNQGQPSQATLDSTDQPETGFTPDLSGTYIVELIVFDSFNTPSMARSGFVHVGP